MHPAGLLRHALEQTASGLRLWLDRRALFVRDIGLPRLGRQAPRALVAYTPWFIRHLVRYAGIGTDWDPQVLRDRLPELALPFSRHTNHWESAELVRQLVERGFVVDVVSDRHAELVADLSRYDLFIDAWNSLPRWRKANPAARALYYATTGHWIFANRRELERHAWLLARRGADVPTVRQVPPLLGPQVADLVTSFGNDAVNAHFGSACSRLRKLWISATVDDVPELPRDWSAARRRFLFMGSTGWVHRGLDLVLEALLPRDDLALEVVGPFTPADAPELWQVYGDELRAARHIRFHGILNPESAEFRQRASSCGAVLYPSASEGCSGTLVQCLHFGLLPVGTPVVGLEAGSGLRELTSRSDAALVGEICAACEAIASEDPGDLQRQSSAARAFARAHHTRAAYAESLARVLQEALPPGLSRPVPAGT